MLTTTSSATLDIDSSSSPIPSNPNYRFRRNNLYLSRNNKSDNNLYHVNRNRKRSVFIEPSSDHLKKRTINEDTDHSRHSNLILNGFQTLKSNRILCDVTLVAQETRFDVHKVVMASCSDYFRSMFTTGMLESTQTVIELKAVTALGLEKLIEIIYTSRTQFATQNELFDAISAASHLQCLLVTDYCTKNFTQRIDLQNYGLFIQMAEMYQMENAMESIDQFIADNLVDLVNRSVDRSGIDCFESDSGRDGINHPNVLTYHQLLKCLLRNDIRIKEIDLFLLTWKWINNILLSDMITSQLKHPKRNKRINMIRSLMKQIRFALISPNDLVNSVQKIHKIMTNDTYLRHLVLKALNYHVMPSLQSSSESNSQIECSDDDDDACDEQLNLQVSKQNAQLNINLRSPVKSILSIGGREINPTPSLHSKTHILNDYFHPNPSNDDTNRITLSDLPNNLSHMQTVVVNNNFLFALGGCVSQCAHGESAVNTVHRYDPRLNVWICVKPMQTKRAYFYACALNVSKERGCEDSEMVCRKEFIYVMGGRNREGPVSSVERYDMVADRWEFVRSMPAAYYAHSGCVLNNRIYITGGYTHNQFTSDVHCYSPSLDQWQQLTQMNSPRGWHCMCIANEKMYVFGGCFLNNNNGNNNNNMVNTDNLINTENNNGVIQQLATHRDGINYPNTLPHHPQIAQPVTCTEFFCPNTNRWSLAKPMPNLHKEATCFLMNTFIHVLGGYNIQAKTGQRAISRYDFVNDLWDSGHQNQMPEGVTGMGLVVMDLPWFIFEAKSCGFVKVQCDQKGVMHDQKVIVSRSRFNCSYLYDESGSSDSYGDGSGKESLF